MRSRRAIRLTSRCRPRLGERPSSARQRIRKDRDRKLESDLNSQVGQRAGLQRPRNFATEIPTYSQHAMSRRTRRPGQAGHTDSENRACRFGSFKVAFREPRTEQDQSQCSGFQCLLLRSRAPFDERTRANAPTFESLRRVPRRRREARQRSRRHSASAARPRHVARRVPPVAAVAPLRLGPFTGRRLSLEHRDSESLQASVDVARRSSCPVAEVAVRVVSVQAPARLCRRGRPPGGGSPAARKMAGRSKRLGPNLDRIQAALGGGCGPSGAQIDRAAGVCVPAAARPRASALPCRSLPHPPRRLRTLRGGFQVVDGPG